jgi:dihydroorotate dehydrogenase
LGFNSEGHQAALARLAARPRGIVGVNLGANRESADRIVDYVSGLERFAPVADYLAVNISSPNTPGLRDLQAPKALDTLLSRLADARAKLPGGKPPLLVKLAPDLADDDLPEILKIVGAHGIDGLIVSNTTLARDGLSDAAFAAKAGGLSGRPLFARSTRLLGRVYRLTQGKLPLIGVGGIDSEEAALAKIEVGASLLELYTGLVFEGPALIGRIKQAVVGAMEREALDSLASLIGRRAEEWAARKL